MILNYLPLLILKGLLTTTVFAKLWLDVISSAVNRHSTVSKADKVLIGKPQKF
jgi:hypothetical protein